MFIKKNVYFYKFSNSHQTCILYHLGENLLICPAKVKSFSLGVRNEFYYNCTKEGEVPLLERCPDKQVYWAAKEKCSSEIMNNGNSESLSKNSDLHTYTEPVLGRTVYLGCLFDAKKSEILAGDSFWKRETVTNSKITSTSFSSILYFFAAQSTFDRFSHMDFDASLKLEFLGKLKFRFHFISTQCHIYLALHKLLKRKYW